MPALQFWFERGDRQECLSYSLERKERFELSRRVWKTRMFPATSLPQEEFRIFGFRILDLKYMGLLAGFEPAATTFEASCSSS